MRGPAVVLLVSLALAAFPARADGQGTVALKLSPAAPVKGRDTSALLEIELPVERPAPPVLRANVGQFEAIERVGPGRWRARYVLPTTRIPEVAIIVAFAAWPYPQSADGAFGVLRVPIASAVEVPGRAERGASVVLTIAGVAYGPVTAAENGEFKLPVVVPPGFGIARVDTRDRAGNKHGSSIDLALPPTDQLACVVTPTLLPADGASRARLLCATSDRYGAPTKGAHVVWNAGRGALGAPRELGNGLQEWAWTSPRDPGEGLERLVATWKQGGVDSTEEVAVGLSQGAVAAVEVVTPDDVAHRGSSWSAQVVTRDRLGRPLGDVVVTAWDQRAATDKDGRATLTFAVPETAPLGERALDVVAFGPLGKEPAALRAWAVDGGVGVLVSDLSGLPVPNQRVVAGSVSATTDERGVTVVPSGGVLHHADWTALATDGGLEPARPEVRTTARVAIVPAVPINVRIRPGAKGAFEWWVEGRDGKPIDGRKVELRDAKGARQVVSRGQSREAGVAPGLVSVTDVESHVTAIIEVAP